MEKLKDAPDDPVLHNKLGVAYFELNNIELAKNSL